MSKDEKYKYKAETWFRLIGSDGGEVGVARLIDGEFRFEPDLSNQNFTAEGLREIAGILDLKNRKIGVFVTNCQETPIQEAVTEFLHRVELLETKVAQLESAERLRQPFGG